MARRIFAALLTACLTIGPMAAHAALVTVGGKQFEITTSLTTFNAYQTELQSQPWWSNQATAASFAQALGDFPYQGLQGNGDYGPLFAFGLSLNDNVNLCSWYNPTDVVQCSIGSARTDVVSYAFAKQVVPLPAALPLLIVGLTGLGVLGRRPRKPATV